MNEEMKMRIVYLKCTKSNNPAIFTVGKQYPVEALNCNQKTAYTTGNDGSKQAIATNCLTQGENFWFAVA